MSERRRFFPATPVQRVPGRTVELEMQLRPEAPVVVPAPQPAPLGECDLVGAGWLLGSHLDSWYRDVLQVDALPDGRTRIWDAWGETVDSLWVGEPAHVDENGAARPIPGPGFRCVHVGVRDSEWAGLGSLFHAVLQGEGMTQAHWQFAWSGRAPGEPVSPLGHVVTTWGNVLQVRAVADETGSGGESLLTATAFCGGRPVDELTLRFEQADW